MPVKFFYPDETSTSPSKVLGKKEDLDLVMAWLEGFAACLPERERELVVTRTPALVAFSLFNALVIDE